MIEVIFTSTFLRQYKKLSADLRLEVDEKIELFRRNPRDPSLRLHKLKGEMKGYLSFSVNYTYRIIIEEDSKDIFALLSVGDHDVYK